MYECINVYIDKMKTPYKLRKSGLKIYIYIYVVHNYIYVL